MGVVSSGINVLLSNAYAAVGRWEEVARARKMLRDQGIKKETGLSWVEEGNRVHTFAAGDRSHGKTNEIYEKVEELGEKIVKAGLFSLPLPSFPSLHLPLPPSSSPNPPNKEAHHRQNPSLQSPSQPLSTINITLYLEDDDSLLRGMMIKGSEYERVLRYLDEDGDEKISACELRNKIGMLGGEVGLREAQMVIAAVDSDSDGFLCLEDWVKMMEGVEDARKESEGEGGRKFGKIESVKKMTCQTIVSHLSLFLTPLVLEDEKL
ncbi:hypothetical protein LR48_Vigan08g034600 [Vigna angularis]|uniref:EF-hand domain-containing protein n=1 Tax=Phaseolus angularis TaxID=3914 RepID=A0A0L9V4A2_PHAAN|nr:hypothetical protein LR48_Vigan08g034600 [Vigna angularis]